MEIGKLEEISPRKAWPHEAHDFTPWLAENLDSIAEAIGIPLEFEGIEVAVDNFSADILARCPADDTVVLIENQLEKTDHTHLGQIMTYLAGVNATTVIWIACGFREPHLAAIKWLNEHTVEPFAFFAINLRAVKIGSSAIAPVFDVVERPNQWERRLQAKTSETKLSERGVFRRAFWTEYLDRYPDDRKLGVDVVGVSSNWANVLEEPELNVSIYCAASKVGVFVRGGRGSDGEDQAEILQPHDEELSRRLDANYGRKTGGFFYSRDLRGEFSERSNWPEAIDWLHERLHVYLETLRNQLGSK